MKYFTEELCSKMNSESRKDVQEADDLWDKNYIEYWEGFDKLSNRVSKRVFDRLKHHGFHDFLIKKIEVIQDKFLARNPVKVVLTITNGYEELQITYKRIRKLRIDFIQESNIPRDVEKTGIDTWGYDELLDVDEETLSHEILSSSNATILIHFKNRNIYIKNLGTMGVMPE